MHLVIDKSLQWERFLKWDRGRRKKLKLWLQARTWPTGDITLAMLILKYSLWFSLVWQMSKCKKCLVIARWGIRNMRTNNWDCCWFLHTNSNTYRVVPQHTDNKKAVHAHARSEQWMTKDSYAFRATHEYLGLTDRLRHHNVGVTSVQDKGQK